MSCPGQVAQGRELCVPAFALEPMTTTTSPRPRRAPGPHPHLKTSERSAADTREATAAALAARETPQVSGTPSPWLGVPLPLTLAVLLAPPRPAGGGPPPPALSGPPATSQEPVPTLARKKGVRAAGARMTLPGVIGNTPTNDGRGRRGREALAGS